MLKKHKIYILGMVYLMDYMLNIIMEVVDGIM